MIAARRPAILVIVIVVTGLLAVLIGVGVYGLLKGPAAAYEPPNPSVASRPAEVQPIAYPRPLPRSHAPATFAQAAAMAMFRWDTRSSTSLSGWGQVLVDAADPDEAAGLAADVRAYQPTTEQWKQLRTYGTRQWLTIETARVPTAWATAAAQAAPGQLPPGATAYTIVGVRHRAGTWADQATATRSRVTFTVFIACPDAQACRLLRFSRLDQPLE